MYPHNSPCSFNSKERIISLSIRRETFNGYLEVTLANYPFSKRSDFV